MSSPRVCVVALDRVVTFDLACAVQILRRGAAGESSPDGFELWTCGVRPGHVSTVDGFGLTVDHGLETIAGADLVVVPGRHPYREPPPAHALDALRDAHEAGATVLSICIGAFVLAHAGMLDDRPATTHWACCDDLTRDFPRIDVRAASLYVDDGDVLTSAGLACGLDLCLHVVRRAAGAATAARLARWNVVAPHREGGQAQFIPAPAPASPQLTDTVGPTIAWALEHLHEPLTISRLARHACVSERTFSRHFRTQTGTTPKRWLLAQRVALARELLEATDLPVETIAGRAGFASSAALRDHLRRHTSTSPSAYRRSFRTSQSA